MLREAKLILMSTPATEENNQNSNPEIYYLKNSDLEKNGLIDYGTFNRITNIMNVYANHKTNAPITWI
ncbi:MAG: hypothetical protein ACM31J_03845 [Nitrososphaerales archaeon]